MSIYSEHALGYLSDSEFAQACRDEEWLTKCRTERSEEEEAFEDWQNEMISRIKDVVDKYCEDCEATCDCEDCVANAVQVAIGEAG